MFYWLGYEHLYHLFSPFRVFQYTTFRTAMASLTAVMLFVLLGPWFIARLRKFQIGQHIREDGPQSHQKKAGTPTMGGLLICGAIVLSTLLWANLRVPAVWVAMAGLVTFGAIGFWDDYLKIRRKRNLGLTVRQKFMLEILAAVVMGVLLLGMNASRLYTTEINVPFFKDFKPDLLIHGWLNNPWTYPLAFGFFFFFVVLVLVGASNAVNLTDGLDGLAIGLMLIAAGAMTVLAFLEGNAELARYLELSRPRDAAELTIFCSRAPRRPIARRAGPRRRTGNGRGVVEAGAAAIVHRRRVCGRAFVGHPPGRQLQAAGKTNLQNGPLASPFRTIGVGRI